MDLTNFGLTKGYALVPVMQVKHYSKRLFSFITSRPNKLVFKAGEFVMLGLIINDKLVLRAYSICAPSWKDELEFYSIKVPGGELTTFLQKISNKNAVIIKTKSTGTLTLSALRPGKRLYLLCTGTGIAPFVSILFEPEVYDKFEQVIVVLTCRQVNELNFLKDKITQLLHNAPLKAVARGKARFYATTTRERSQFMGRIPHLIKSGILTNALGGLPLNARDRFMICGSQEMIKDVTTVLTKMGFKEGSKTKPRAFVYEKAFTD